MLYRKQRYVHRCKLDWDAHSSAGRYVRKHCKPLKVRGILQQTPTHSVLECSCTHHTLKIHLVCLFVCFFYKYTFQQLQNSDVYLLYHVSGHQYMKESHKLIYQSVFLEHYQLSPQK